METLLIIIIVILLLTTISTHEENKKLRKELKSRDFGNRYIKK
jgi:hypothetical protein